MPLQITIARTQPRNGNRSSARFQGRILRGLLVPLVSLAFLACSGSHSDESPGEGLPRAVGPALEGKLRCASPRLDFGLVYEGSVLEAVFDLEVATDDAFSIKDVRADCGCTTAGLLRAPGGDLAQLEEYRQDMPLFAGDILRLSVIYDTRGKGGQTQRKITLYADVPEGRVVLALEADIRPWLISEPSQLILGRMGHRETREEHLRIYSVADEPFRLEHDRRGIPDTFTVVLSPLEPGADGRAREWDAHLRLGPDMPEGTHQYPLYFTSDHALPGLNASRGTAVEPLTNTAAPQRGEQAPLASTTPQVIVEVVGLYLAEPTSFTFQQVDGVSTVARTVHLRCFDGPFSGEALPQLPTARVVVPAPPAESPDQAPTTAANQALLETARVDVHPNPEGGWNVQLLLEGLAPEVGKTFLALVLVDTGNPDQEVVEIPVLGFRTRDQASSPVQSGGS